MKIFDGHNDTLNRKYSSHPLTGFDFLKDNPGMCINLPKAKAGNLAGGIFAVYTSGEKLSQERAEETAENIRNDISEIERRSAGSFKLCTSSGEIQEAIDEDVFAATFHFEGAEPIMADLSNLEYWYQKGLRSIGITWNRENAFADSIKPAFGNLPDKGKGLTDAGKELVRQCNKLGIMIDMSHLSAAGVCDVLSISEKPVAATHSNPWRLCNHPRNLTDDQLKAIAENGGVVGINFYTRFLSPTGELENKLTLESITGHFKYIADLIGVHHLAIGSDFDGAGMPDCLSDASKLPGLVTALAGAGFSTDELELIAHKNWLRVFPE